MGEHALRYADVAVALNARGAVVYGYDHRGHGKTVAGAGLEPGDLGEGGWQGLVDDIGLVVTKARAENPGLPVLLIAHSMGSFAAQQYLLDHSGDVDAAVLSGTASIDLLEPALGDLDGPMDLAAFNARFEPARTGYEWLSRDEEQVDRYVADPMCGFGIDAAATKGMFAGARRLADPANIEIRKDLPIYIVVGSLRSGERRTRVGQPARRPVARGRRSRTSPSRCTTRPATRCSTRPTVTRSSATCSPGPTTR